MTASSGVPSGKNSVNRYSLPVAVGHDAAEGAGRRVLDAQDVDGAELAIDAQVDLQLAVDDPVVAVGA